MDNDALKAEIGKLMHWAFTLGRQYEQYQEGDERREIIQRRLETGIKEAGNGST